MGARGAETPVIVMEIRFPQDYPLSVPFVRMVRPRFKWHTGQGADTLTPRAISLLSDATPSMLVYIMWLAEHWERWPTQLMAVHIVLLAKPKGGWRPIALLQAVYRVWSQVRGGQLRDWLLEHQRPYFALAAGKTTLDVASRALLHAEAALADAAAVIYE